MQQDHVAHSQGFLPEHKPGTRRGQHCAAAGDRWRRWLALLSAHSQLAGQPQKRTPMFQARTTRFFVDVDCHDHNGACGGAAHAEPPRQCWGWFFILPRVCFYNPKPHCVVPIGEGKLKFTIYDVMAMHFLAF